MGADDGRTKTARPDIAIIGMACIFPKAPRLQVFWENIVSKVDAIDDPPQEWEASLFYDPNSGANDRIYCTRGGYLGELARFDPLEYGIMPTSVDGGEPDHHLALRVAHEALADSGYLEKPLDPERTEVILGRGTYVNRGITNLVQHGLVIEQTLEILRELHPEHTDEELQKIKTLLKASLPPFTAETVPSLVPNILSGRIANRLNFMGANYVVDAACASSLIAVQHAMRSLRDGSCDLAVAGGIHASTPPLILMIFCQLNALSRRSHMRPFDKEADGTMLGEGLGVIVLKRREDAERDGDRIYAFLKEIGVSSDGRALGLLAPRVEGEILAIRRAYAAAGIDPRSVGLIEAHGTATPAGDVTEVQALSRVFDLRPGDSPYCALGTVKSMIGHCIPASGIAGLIKTALALYHKVLPPTLHCDEPNPKLELEKTPFYINTETRPWIHGSPDAPRRAGVDAFGFGGINAHAILEECITADDSSAVSLHRRWDTEAFVIESDSQPGLCEAIRRVRGYVSRAPEVDLKDLAYTLNAGRKLALPLRLGLVAATPEELDRKLGYALERLADPACHQIKERSGIYFFKEPLGEAGKLAFLFPGEGSQYVNMLSDLCIHFRAVRSSFDLMERAFAGRNRGDLLRDLIFPIPVGKSGRDSVRDEPRLWRMEAAAQAVFAANQALFALMTALDIRADAMVGHSTGEYSALLASGALQCPDEEALLALIRGVDQVYQSVTARGEIPTGVLLAVGGGERHVLESIIAESEGQIGIAIDNCPHQMVLFGSEEAATRAARTLGATGAICTRLPFNRGYHTPHFGPVCGPLRAFFAGQQFAAARLPVYSCVTAEPYPMDPEAMRDLVTIQWARTVRFRDTIERMYADGVRIFVEVGPSGNLTSFVDDCLRSRPHVAVPTNLRRRSGMTQINHLVALLSAHHVSLRLDSLYDRRAPQQLPLDDSDSARVAPASPKVPLVLPRLRIDGKQSRVAKTAPADPPPGAASTKGKVVPAGHPGLGSFSVTPRSSRLPLRPPPDHVPPKPSHVVAEYLRTMESFLASEEDVMRAYLGAAKAQPSVVTSEQTAVRPCLPVTVETAQTVHAAPSSDRSMPGGGSRRPLVGEILSWIPARELLMVRRIDVEQDIFLKHHILGGTVSQADPDLKALPLMPLTMSMELLAEAAALLAPGKTLIGMKNIRAYSWLALDEGIAIVQVVARRKEETPEGEIEVQARSVTEASIRDISPGMPMIEGTMIFGDSYSQAPKAEELPLRAERPSRWSSEHLYAGFMFHGPSFQGVASIDRTGEDGTEASLQALPADGLFRSDLAPAFLSDPVLLDAAGQVIAYWTEEHLPTAYHIFPYRLEALELYAPPLRAPDRARCRARVALLGESQVRSDIDIVGRDNRLLMRMVGWEDRRFDLPERLFLLRTNPRDGFVSLPVPSVIERLSSGNFACAFFDGFSGDFLQAHGKIWRRALAHLILSRRERETWRSMQGPDKRRLEWLLGRAAAKDAVRFFLLQRYGLRVCPADVEIDSNERGEPIVSGRWVKQAGATPLLTLSHSGGTALAVAGEAPGRGIGVDIERVEGRDKGFEWLALAFTETERRHLDALGSEAKAEWLLRLWCGKESVAKALGRGLPGGPGDLIVQELDPKTGRVSLNISGQLARQLPLQANECMIAHTLREAHHIVAIALCPRS